MSKRLITLDDVRQAAREGKKHLDAWPVDSIITPMARDEAERLGIELRDGSQACAGQTADTPAAVAAVAPAAPEALQAEGVVRHICNLIQDRLPTGVDAVDARDLERTVREVVAAKLKATGAPAAPAPRPMAPASGVTRAECRRLLADRGTAPDRLLLAEAIRPGGDAKLGGCYMSWENGTHTRKMEHAEIAVVIEGEMQLTVGGSSFTAGPGDMVYLPAGAEVVYQAPSRVTLACVDRLG